MNMYYSKLFSILVALTASSWVAADDFPGPCTSEPGIVNGQCVRVYNAAGCQGPNQISEFKPNVCDGTCFNTFADDGSIESFLSLSVVGDGISGTDCKVYSDTQCQNEVSDTGNHVPAPAFCAENPTAQSMKCFFKC